MNLADRNEAKYTPEVVSAMLADYSESARAAIESEARIWRYGNVESARQSYDQAVTFARIQPHAPARRYRMHGAWFANDSITLAAMCQVMAELGESTEGDAYLS